MKKILLALVLMCSALLSKSAAINVSSSQGHFTAAAPSDCAPEVITFDQIGIAYAGATNVKYWYGDGASSTTLALSATPTHNYTNAGTYDVWADYYSASGSYLGYQYLRIELYGDPSGVNAQQTAACPGDLVSFYVNMGWSQSPVNSYTWNFGDGVTEVSDWYSISHTYAASGTYNVSVTVTGPCGTFVENTTFTVGTNIPFSGGYLYQYPDPVCPNEEVGFSFPNVYAQYMITFGDGTYSNSDYYHAYAQTGTYVASVTLTNGCGNSGTYYDTVHVVGNIGFNPNQNIYVYNSSPICPGQDVHFDTWNAYDAIWHFSDGTTDTSMYTKKEINSQVDDTVYLTVFNGCGADTTVMTIVDVVNNLPVDEINLTVADSVCTGSYFPYMANGQSEIEADYSYSWDFGDGTTSNSPNGSHNYAANGTYNVTLHITNGCGNDSTQTAQVFVGPGIAPDPDVQLIFPVPEDGSCPGDTALFVLFPYVPGTYSFDFGDGFTTSTMMTIPLFGNTYGAFKHAYSTPGTYNVSMTYTNSCGLSYTKTGTYEISSGTPISENGLFYDESLNICLGEPVTFYAYGGSIYQWDFGDGSGTFTSYNTFIPTEHIYENPGVYTVRLKVTNSCGNTDVYEENVVIPDNRISIVTNTVDANCGQSDGKAIAVINGGNSPYDIYWSNGASGILVDSLASGIYVVNVTDESGCYNFGIATVSDAQAPAIVLNNVVDVTCNGGNDGALDINVIGNSAPYTYHWSNGSTSEDQAGLQAAPYEIYVHDANGCVATASFNVNEPDEVQVSFNIVKPGCGLSNGIITANALGNSGPFTYVWSNGHTGQTMNNVAAGIYTVNVIDQVGCIITQQVAVSEDNGMGGPIISTNSISPLNCNAGAGSTIDISVYFANGAVTYNWSDGQTAQDANIPQEGTYTVTVTDGAGCKAIEIFTIENAAPDPLSICMVSVDSVYNFNKVIFEKPFSNDIEYFKIYRESSQAGLYYHIGNVHYDSLSVFNDGVPNPMVQAWRYKISAVDFCGKESALSPEHKTIHLNQNLGLIPGTVNLIWDHYEGFNFGTYDIVRYTQTGGWQVIASTSAQNTSWTDPAAPLSDPSLYYVVTATPPATCVSTRAQNNGTTRSNRTQNALQQPGGSSVEQHQAAISQFNLYPNPNNGQFTVEMTVGTSTDVVIEITDMVGKLIQTMTVPCRGQYMRKDIDLTTVPTGVYFVRVSNGNGYLVNKVIKN